MIQIYLKQGETQMKKIRIVTDTTSTLTFEEAKSLNIELVPLSLLLDGKEYKDHIDMSTQQLYDVLKNDGAPTTSQPNIGYVEELMKAWKEEKDDAIIIITISSHLSGTYQGFSLIANQLGMDNVHIVDTLSVAAPLMDACIAARNMADRGCEVDEILKMVENKCKNSISFLYPETLKQLKRGGRISPLAANMASMLKIKALLMLKRDGTVIDKYAVVRTEGKIFDMVIEYFKKEGVDGSTHKIYLPHALSEDTAARFDKLAKDKLNGIQCKMLTLPAVLTCHGGLGCIAFQSVIKNEYDN